MKRYLWVIDAILFTVYVLCFVDFVANKNWHAAQWVSFSMMWHGFFLNKERKHQEFLLDLYCTLKGIRK